MFSKIDAFPISNALTAASFASSNFLVIVSPGAGGKPLFAGRVIRRLVRP